MSGVGVSVDVGASVSVGTGVSVAVGVAVCVDSGVSVGVDGKGSDGVSEARAISVACMTVSTGMGVDVAAGVAGGVLLSTNQPITIIANAAMSSPAASRGDRCAVSLPLSGAGRCVDFVFVPGCKGRLYNASYISPIDW